MPRNHDFDRPTADGVDNTAVLESFVDLPIFWGPNQLNTGFSFYNVPNGWRDNEQLNIPQVIRFFHNGETEYDTEFYSDDVGPLPPPTYTWVITNYQYGTHDGTIPLGVYWTLQDGTTHPFCICFTGTMDTPLNFLAMQIQYPWGLVGFSTSSTVPCADVMH